MIDPEKIWSSSQLPTLPSVAIALLDISRDPDATIQQVVELIKTDPAISAKIIKSTNSSFFGFSSEITSIERAVPLLGTTAVTSLALSFSLHESSMASGPLAQYFQSYWMQSVIQALAAEVLVDDKGTKSEGKSFLSGLLLDIGRLAMLKTIPMEYAAVLDQLETTEQPLQETETRLLGVDHMTVGVKMMTNWRLPEDLRAAVESHHASLDQIRSHEGTAAFGLIKVSAVAAATGEYFCATGKGPALTRLRQLTTELYGYAPSDLDNYLERVTERIEKTGHLFSLNPQALASPGELMAQANEHLAHLALRAQMASTEAVAKQQEAEREKEKLASQNEELQQQSLHDPLTKIYNRRFFDEALENEINRCRREAGAIGLLFSDIDHFKNLNDTYGHQFGDKVLGEVAVVFKKSLRRSDILARFGGEEFVILVQRPTKRGLQKLAERIRSSVEEAEFLFDDSPVPVTISIGAAIAMPGREELDLATRLLDAADAAMYESKRNGRNRVTVRSLIDGIDQRLILETTKRRFSHWLVTHHLLDIPTASKIVAECVNRSALIGDLAIQQGFLNADQVTEILADQPESRERFGAIAIRLGILTEDQLVELLVLQDEDPVSFAKTLIRTKALDVKQVAEYMKQYLAECLPHCQTEAIHA